MTNGRKFTSYFNADSSGFKKGIDQMVYALEKVNKELVNNQYRQKECSKVISINSTKYYALDSNTLMEI